MSKPTLEENIHSFMLKCCRPYNANDIQTYLKSYGDYGKTELQRAIDKMVSEGKLVEKTYGKQKVYLINQADLPVASPEELRTIEANIQKLEEELKEKETIYQTTQRELKLLRSEMTVEELNSAISEVKKGIESAKEKLKSYETAEPIDPIECKKVKTERENVIKEWKAAKRQCMEIVNTVMENYPGSKKDLMEEIGIETDEDAGVQMLN